MQSPRQNVNAEDLGFWDLFPGPSLRARCDHGNFDFETWQAFH
jgi:hypothetical protein